MALEAVKNTFVEEVEDNEEGEEREGKKRRAFLSA